VIAITQQIDLSGPVGHLIASLLFGIAEIELQHAKERQAVGIALARKRGIYNRGQPRPRARPEKQGLTVGGNRQSARDQGANSLYNYLSDGR
jgi:DNA invertase Pin-like site-specific DNA recombinase